MSAMSRPPLPYASRHECEEKGGQETRARLLQTQARTAVHGGDGGAGHVCHDVVLMRIKSWA